jgi:hypothetical protein
MEFLCTHKTEKRHIRWIGMITSCKGNKEKCEFELQSRGSNYHVIIGKHDYGYYVCIPNWDVGSELAYYSDIFWNTERLSKHLKIADAITVATAIREIERLL